MSLTSLTVLVVYLVAMVGIALWFSRRKSVTSGEDFMFAGRSLNSFVLGCTLLATFVGSGSIIGGANFVFTYGPLTGLVFSSGLFAGIICLAFIARRVRIMKFNTVPDLFRRRYGSTTSVIGTVVVLIAFIGISAYQFTGAGYIFSLIVPVTEFQGTLIAVVLIGFLALSGGLKSVAWTDFASSIFLALGLAVALFYIFITDMGGFGSYVDQLDPEFLTFTGTLGPLQMLGFFLPLFLLILGDQNMHQRLASAKSPATAVKAMIVFLVGAVLTLGITTMLASSASILNPDVNPDMAILGLAAGEFTPPLIGAMILVAALAIILTTGSSYLLTCSGNVVYDLIFRPRAARRERPDAHRKEVLFSRLSILVIAVLGYVMVQFFPTLLALQMYAYTMYGAAITPAVIAALFWKRATSVGAISSILVAAVATIGWEVFGSGEVMGAVVLALPASVLALVMVSLLTKPHETPPGSALDPERGDAIESDPSMMRV
ncbi:sodium:solute symporter family protein [Nesterenkonia suensis]